MPTLSSAIVKQGVASVSDVEQALARQTLYGGDLATNLLEITSVSEARLAEVLSEVHGAPAASVGELPRARDDVLRLVPGDLTQRQGIYPLEEREGTLLIAVSEPLAGEVEQDLSFALGVRIEQRTAPLVRIRQAIARDYGLPLERRMLRLLAKLEGRPDPSPSSLPAPTTAAQELGSLPRPESVPPFGYPTAAASPTTGEAHSPNRAVPDRPSGRRSSTLTGVAPPSQAQPPAEAVTPPTPAPGETSENRKSTLTGVAPPSVAPQERPAPVPPSAAAEPSPVAPVVAVSDRPSQPPSMRVPPRRGPYLGALAEHDLASARSRDSVMRAFFDYAAQYFEYSALFAVHGEIAEGREARGPGADRRQIRSIGVPLDLPGALRTVQLEGSHKILRLGTSGLDGSLNKDLRRTGRGAALLLPVLVRKRCVLIFYGDHGESNVAAEEVADVIEFAPLVSRALERIILERKRAVLAQLAQPVQQPQDPGQPHRAAPQSQHPARTEAQMASDRASALAHAVQPEEERRASADPSEPPPSHGHPESLAPPLSQPPGPPPTPPSPIVAPVSPIEPPAALAPSPAVPTPRPARAEVVPSLPWAQSAAQQPRPTPAVTARPTVPIEGDEETQPAPADVMARAIAASRDDIPEPKSRTGADADRDDGTAVFPLTRRSVPVVGEAEPPEEGWDSLPPGAPDASFTDRLTDPGMGAFVPRAPTPPPPPHAESRQVKPAAPPANSDDGPEIVLQETEQEDDAPDISVGTAELDAGWAVEESTQDEYAPASKSLSYAPRRPRPPHDVSKELALPSVIVDPGTDAQTLVARLLAGDTKAETDLLGAGTAGVLTLMMKFPGPMQPAPKSDRASAPLKASSLGPVLHALARMGPMAVKELATRAQDRASESRVWALRLLGEIPGPASAAAVLPGLLDQDSEVRNAALDAGRLLQADEDSRRALYQGLGDLASNSGEPIPVRRRAVEALASLREPQAVPLLIRLLEEGTDEIAGSVHGALFVITRQDFGRDARRWRDWWKRNQARHRIEWLIDSLTHELAEIRKPAGEELKRVSKEYFGYYDDLPRKERARVQKRYRHWWDTKGKPLFR